MSVNALAIWRELILRALRGTGVESCAFPGFKVETCTPNLCG
jgi:hypothetical protein